MARNAERPTTKRQTTKKQATATKKHATMKQGKSSPRVSKEFEEATKLAIKVHRRALKELEKH